MSNLRRAFTAAAALTTLAAAVSACGGSTETGTAGSEASGNSTDRAFVEAMIPHHESAIEMARMAKDDGESVFVGSLADDIISSQGDEIETMRSIDAELASARVEEGDLGMDDSMMGMDSDTQSLSSAQPFDRAFIDLMVPHHQGAIHMARVELSDGENAELKALAEAIVEAQSREINEMNAYREKEYGGPSPAGGVPDEGDAMIGTEHSSPDHAESEEPAGSGDSMGGGEH